MGINTLFAGHGSRITCSHAATEAQDRYVSAFLAARCMVENNAYRVASFDSSVYNQLYLYPLQQVYLGDSHAWYCHPEVAGRVARTEYRVLSQSEEQQSNEL